MVRALRLLPSKDAVFSDFYLEQPVSQHSWLLSLGNGWYEAECCVCGADLLVAPGDAITVIVGQNQNIDAVLCTVCSKHAPRPNPAGSV